MAIDLDAMLVKKINQARKTRIGKAVHEASEQIGGPPYAAALNFVCTGALGFIITFPIYELGGPWAALPTGGFTIILLAIIALSIIVNAAGTKPMRKVMRPMLIFAIMFSLPFGLLSIPLLNELSPPRKKVK